MNYFNILPNNERPAIFSRYYQSFNLKKWDLQKDKKKSYERRAYESVGDMSLS